MTEKDDLQQRAAAVAREKAGQFPENRDALSSEEMRQMVHELRVHQIELEMQNEELRRAQMELDATRARYFDLYDLAPVGYLTINSQGLILEANLTVASLLGMVRGELLRQPLTRFLHPDSQDTYYHHRKQVFETEQPQTCDFRMIRNDGMQFWARLEAVAAKGEDGAPVCLIAMSDTSDRKRAEDALHLFMESVENASDAIGMSTPEGKHYYQNAAFTHLFGQIGDDPPSTLYMDEAVGKEVFRAVMAGERWDGEVRMYAKDRRVLDILLRAYANKDSDGRVTGLVGIHTDITERNWNEKALRLNELRLAALLELSQMSAESEKTLTDFALEKAIELTGSTIGYLSFLTPDESILVMYSWSKTAMRECTMKNKPVEYPVEQTGLWGEAVRQRRPVITNDYEAENPWKKGCPEGHVRLSRHMNIPLFDGERIVLVAGVGNKAQPYENDDLKQLTLLMDGLWKILKTKRMENDLRESERKLATLIANIQGMVYFCLNDPDWTMKFVSGGALELTGYLPEELVDNAVVSYNDIIHPDDRQYVWDTVQDSFAARSAYTLEYRIVTKKGAVKRVWERGQGIFLPGGELHHLEGFIADITDRKALEDRLHRARKMESVGRLAGGVAHDFNNMLGVILGFVELALDRIDAAHPVHNDLLEIREAAKRSAGLTRQLLAFASLQPAAPKLLDLNETVEGLLQMLRRLIGEEIHLVWMRGAGLGPVKMDPSQIDQILVNLCVNARDAISGPGNVTIETRAAAFDKAFCAEHPDFIPGDYASLSVSDDGCGMDKETLVNIFEPFFTTKGLIDGPGLGLSTIYGIVRQNKGFIDVHSEPGVGTTFNIYLPLHPVPIVPASVPASPEPLKHGRETILLVEDEPAVLKVTEMMLAHIGYTVLAVNTPDKAFRIAEAHAGDIALLITDVVMPEMNGKDLAMKLQSLYPRLKCLFMSGYMADIITPDNVLEEGVHFLQKPFTIKGLAATVREVLEFEDI
ncbi:MAG: PAS domain-containing protein [Desulfosalsimonadaceae bacterium]